MRRSTTTLLGLSAVCTVLVLTGCAGHAESADSSAAAHRGGSTPSASVPLSSTQLNQRLLNESDLGEGYTRKPEAPRRNDDVTVIGCPALEKLGGDTASGSGLDFARKAKASFTYSGSSSSLVSSRIQLSPVLRGVQRAGHRVSSLAVCRLYIPPKRAPFLSLVRSKSRR
ncbi:hypothetical protein [Streptomyces sp. SAS_270]|uniref:hypothetical protein n=1 Tax=Streptomyces sp. SAS_270 TaxID=3412748 RepID=UPI00403C37C8